MREQRHREERVNEYRRWCVYLCEIEIRKPEAGDGRPENGGRKTEYGEWRRETGKLEVDESKSLTVEESQ